MKDFRNLRLLIGRNSRPARTGCEVKEEYFTKVINRYSKASAGHDLQKPSHARYISFDMAMRHCGGDAVSFAWRVVGQA